MEKKTNILILAKLKVISISLEFPCCLSKKAELMYTELLSFFKKNFVKSQFFIIFFINFPLKRESQIKNNQTQFGTNIHIT